MTLIVYCIVGSYKKSNILLLSVVSQVDPVRSTWTSINKSQVLSFVHHHLVEFSHKYCTIFLVWCALVLEKLEKVYLLVMLGTISIGAILLGERYSS